MNSKILDKNDLERIGFSKNESLLYLFLVKNGASELKTVAKSLKVLPNALYRLVKKLEAKSLVTSLGSHPKKYSAISPSMALVSFLDKQSAEIARLKKIIIGRKASSDKDINASKIDLIKDQTGFFNSYVKEANKANSEILIVSIGEEVPVEIAVANRDALERGVKIYFIAHKSDTTNNMLLTSWIKMGLNVRHFTDWGFHFTVFDRHITLLSVNNPENTNDRVALRFSSSGLSRAFSDYFWATWEKASNIL